MANVYESVLASGGVTPTSITPSNASPAQLVTHVPYEVTQSGYAVATIAHVTPSGEPEPVGTSDMYKMEAAGYVVDQIGGVMPSNASPDALTDDEVVQIRGNGYAIKSYSDITPSDSSPVPIYDRLDDIKRIYRCTSSGYAVRSYTDIEVEDGVQFDAGINKMSAGGYAYTSPRPWVIKSGTLPDFTSVNQEQTINTGIWDELNEFYIEGITSNGLYISSTQFKRSRSFAKQVANLSTSSATTSVNSGNDATGVITTSSNQMKISAIAKDADGYIVVTIKGASNGNYLQQNIKWMAL